MPKSASLRSGQATVIAAIVPMALLYPFVQRFFVQGIVLGAEKG